LVKNLLSDDVLSFINIVNILKTEAVLKNGTSLLIFYKKAGFIFNFSGSSKLNERLGASPLNL
jgi:hypothetical protein